MRRPWFGGMLAGALLVTTTGLVSAQGFGTTGTGGGGGLGGGTGGLGGGTGGGGFGGGGTGGSSSFGTGGTGAQSFATTFGSGTGATGGGRGAGSSQVGSTTPFGKYYGNPLYNGLATGQASSSTGSGAQYQRPFPVTLQFGQQLYANTGTGTATVGRTGIQGTSGLGTLGGAGGLGGLGGTTTQSRAVGASSAGVRRAPAYVTEPVFDVPERRSMDTVRGDLQGIISRSSRLPSRDSIRVSTDGETVILSGRVRDDRERRLAEAVVRLTPGVREVRNQLTVPKRTR